MVSVQDRVKVNLTLAEASKLVRVLVRTAFFLWLSQGLLDFVTKFRVALR